MKIDINKAAQRIKPFINKTPVLTSDSINKISGARIYFKCENFQKVGAFKMRGATNKLLKLDRDILKNGVVTHSSGNHAQALALSAKLNDIKAYIVMPKNAPKVKIDAVKGYGAEIIFCEPTLQARETNAQKIIDTKNAFFVHPYDDYDIIEGQGTAAKELLEEIDNLEIVMAPVGGGGLLSGTAIHTKDQSENIKVYAAEPEGANDAFKSFKAGKHIPSENPDTICDGLLTSVGEKNYKIIMQKVDDILTANDNEIINAMRLIWERMKIIVEPSSAVPLAVILKNPELFEDKNVGVIISGGNVSMDKLPWQN